MRKALQFILNLWWVACHLRFAPQMQMEASKANVGRQSVLSGSRRRSAGSARASSGCASARGSITSREWTAIAKSLVCEQRESGRRSPPLPTGQSTGARTQRAATPDILSQVRPGSRLARSSLGTPRRARSSLGTHQSSAYQVSPSLVIPGSGADEEASILDLPTSKLADVPARTALARRHWGQFRVDFPEAYGEKQRQQRTRKILEAAYTEMLDPREDFLTGQQFTCLFQKTSMERIFSDFDVQPHLAPYVFRLLDSSGTGRCSMADFVDGFMIHIYGLSDSGRELSLQMLEDMLQERAKKPAKTRGSLTSHGRGFDRDKLLQSTLSSLDSRFSD